MLVAALGYARRGWPVFPCSPETKRPLLPRDKDPVSGKPIPKSGGVTKATTDEDQITAWWKRWPDAMIGVAMGRNGCLALDFDPRTEEIVDQTTGEVTTREWTLEQLKADTEAQIGCALPVTLAAMTPSGGVHLYLRQPSGGDPINNRGNLPEHVDVRGVGGYVIAPPSVMADGRRYRWLRGDWNAEIADAPAALVKVLRERKGAPQNDAAADQAASASPPPRASARRSGDPSEPEDDVRKYALTALDGECAEIRRAPSGQRNAQLNASAVKVASLVAAGALDSTLARQCIEAAARDNPGRDDAAQLAATIDSGWSFGLANPRDLTDIRAVARERAARRGGGRSARPSAGARLRDANRSFRPSAPAPPARGGDDPQSFQNGRLEGQSPGGEGTGGAALSVAEKARYARIAEHWLERRLEHADGTKKALTAIAWGIGRRVAAGLLDEYEAKEAIWPHCEDVAGLLHSDIDRAIDDGFNRGFDVEALRAIEKRAGYPLTDFGIAERFRDQHGDTYRFTTAKGWLGWDERRWKVLDQEKDVPPSEVIAAVFATVRAIQDEARFIADTGVSFARPVKKKRKAADEDADRELDLDEPTPHGLDRWVPKGRDFQLYSTIVRAFGRSSETAGKPNAIANLARQWLTVPIEQFDVDPLALNVMNGTLRCRRETRGDGAIEAVMELGAHSREDLITRLAPVAYDPEAQAPLYDAMLEWAQPDAAMRRYLHQVGGLSSTGITGEHKLWFNYGRGRNGKSTTIDSWCSALGDYSGTIGIETFLDQGIKKRGEAASPDLARLGGVRMLRASEPERGAKLNAALIKAATGGEPMAVRALHRGFFDLLPQFKLIMSGNSKPEIPDTDDGIWSRLKLIGWAKNIDLEFNEDGTPKKDPQLLNKIKAAELAGVLKRLVDGLMDYLAHGLVEPADVTRATQAYRDASDPLSRFLRLCTAPDADSRVQSSHLHEVFVAWCKAAGEREWSNKGFSKAMEEKGYTKKASDGMQWLGLKLIRQATDFIDHEGKVVVLPDDMDREPPNETGPPEQPPLPRDGWRDI
ncbi:phage/plasmid primase, P4 family, C-terminal domain-containing protein [Allosphingosinicella indica]|uniref:Phage/plasmid primase, P4 family, C-terminal domain-containing protein n=2 Tax=Allosphingosinicella indica TaxID=941907 RepID=A0A1X7GJB0_9SPHN|nr:phage/plasmid primase, P4 family, C-terminal domain-containing protein [Allosphingosinicella indica]